MAKARPIPGLHEDDPYALAAARVVVVRADELVELSANVLDTDDIERVHDMRVATRRLRAALEVFEPCFPRKPFTSALKDVKALADALGERRDRDVTIAALSEFTRAHRPQRPARGPEPDQLAARRAATGQRGARAVRRRAPDASLREQIIELAEAAEELAASPKAAPPEWRRGRRSRHERRLGSTPATQAVGA